jgi:hypothetical protein
MRKRGEGAAEIKPASRSKQIHRRLLNTLVSELFYRTVNQEKKLYITTRLSYIVSKQIGIVRASMALARSGKGQGWATGERVVQATGARVVQATGEGNARNIGCKQQGRGWCK